MLELLVKYARDENLEPEPGFDRKSVRWAIAFDTAGMFLDVVEIGDTSLKRNPGEEFHKCPHLTQPEMKAGGVIKSHFLIDTAEVVALLGKNADDPKVREKHDYFVGLLTQAGTVMPELGVLASALQDPTTTAAIRNRLEALNARPADKVTFRLGDGYPVRIDAWHDWWRAFRKSLSRQGARPDDRTRGRRRSSQRLPCLVTGRLVEPAATHDKTKGLGDVGGLPTGDALISFKQESFCSYGLVQSANAAVSEEAASAYRAALNDLIRRYGQRLAGAKVVHWFKNKVKPEDDPLPWLVEPEEEQARNAQQRARELLQSIKMGKRPDLGGNYFYALTMSGAAGRVMVRDWMEGQFEELVENILAWFDDLAIVRRDGDGLAPLPKFMAVAGATVRDLRDLPTSHLSKLWRAAVRREPIPHFTLAQALARARVDVIEDQPANHARMGLMKAYHIRQDSAKGGETMSSYLNEEHPHPAYQCGRLMAVLAGLQHAALPGVGAGVVQRYYAAASSTPALVLGRLTRTSQFHLNKLEGGLAHWYETLLGNIWGRIKDSIPTTLTLEEQSLFALGYYQQMANMRTKKSDNSVKE